MEGQVLQGTEGFRKASLSMKFTPNFNERLQKEIRGRLDSRQLPAYLLEALDHLEAGVESGLEGYGMDAGLESIIKAHNRPSLIIQDNQFEVPVSGVWEEVLTDHRAQLDGALPAIGRIEVTNHPHFTWVGTGVLLRPSVVVTNRHVAIEFAERKGDGVVWKMYPAGQASSQIDFRVEHDESATEHYDVLDILHLENDDGLDIAILRIADPGREPLALSFGAADDDMVAAVGYPKRQIDIAPDAEPTMENIFHGIYEVKRLAPGRLTRVTEGELRHDCSTLTGSSGSALLEFDEGKVVGLHFFGGVLSNRAVSASELDRLLAAAS